MEFGVFFTALALGFRHGVDWDHLAAISDLTTSASTRRRGFVLSMIYAVGHGAVVFLLGSALIVFGTAIPASLDDWMGRVVGLTLVGLGAWVLVELVRKGRNFRLRSRWMLVLDGTFAGVRRVRNAAASRSISVRHDHAHEHDQGDHEDLHAHDHAHEGAVEATAEPVPVPTGAATPSRWAAFTRHRHAHRHEMTLPDRPLDRQGGGAAVGVGMLHGIGVESPTQIAVFVAASSVSGYGGGLAVLAAWVGGLLAANAAIAVGFGFGLMQAERNFRLYATVSVVAAVTSIAFGLNLVLGLGELPDITG